MPPPHAGSPPADVCSGPGEGVPCSPLCHAPTHGGMQSPQTPQRFWVLCPSIWASCPAWGDNLTGSLSILVSLCRISPGFPSSPFKGQESAEGRALLPVLAAGSPWGPVLCHATAPIPSRFAVCIFLPSMLCAGARIYFRSRNGTRKERKECVGSRALSVVPIPGRGCSGSSSGAQPSFPAGIFLLWEYPAVPSPPHRLRTPCAQAPWGRDTALALQIRHLYFFL